MAKRLSLKEAEESYSKEKIFLIKALKSNDKTYNFADTAFKLSKSGLLTHRRILQIKNGFLFYYSHVPKDWKSNAIHLLKENPKAAIRLTEILVHYLGVDDAKDMKYIHIQINMKKIINFKKGRNYVENLAKGKKYKHEYL